MASLKRNQRSVIISGLCLLFGITLACVLIPGSQADSAEKTVRESWDLMSTVGQYDFSTTVDQVTYPAPALANVGRSSTKEVYQISGKANLHSDTLNIRLFKNQGSLLNQADGVEIQIEGDQASGRAIGASEWESLDEYQASSFTFGDNSSLYLASAKNVHPQGSKTVALPQDDGSTKKVPVDSYRFDVDPDQYARLMRDQMVQELQRSGKLPIGMELSVSDQYRAMAASGELWVNADGLPIRMTVTMKMPPEKNGDHVEATITTDYFNHNTGNLLAAQTTPKKIAGALGLPTTSNAAREFALQFDVFASSILLVALVLAFSKKKFIYAGVAGLVICSMLVSPIWQGEKSAAFARELRDQNAAIEADKKQAQAEKEAYQNAAFDSWDPHSNPLDKMNTSSPAGQPAEVNNLLPLPLSVSTLNELIRSPQASETGEDDLDSDQDGLTDEYESQYPATVLNPLLADTDRDGLNDNVELKLGLSPGEVDTDGDSIWDNDEVRSFYAGDKDWYLNPEERDTDLDGQMDSAECPERMNGNSTGICRDTDGDQVPDAFDTDDDNDGVPTIYDESPYVVSNLVYSENSPFNLSISNLGLQPVFINYQFIPTNPKHLTYALNVLDWPSDDTDGQIQRISETSYSDSMSGNQVTADPRSQFGDLRLIPMVEIELTGSTYPFPLSRTVSIDVKSEGYEGSFEFASIEGNPGKTDIKLVSGPISSKVLQLGSGNCDEFTTASTLDLHNVGDSIRVDRSLGDLVGGSYVLFLTDATNSSLESCSPIPVVAHGKMTEYVIDSTILQAYGGAARNDDDGDVLVYVPLSVQYDETGGKPVALSVKVPFSNIHDGFANSQQNVRIVWMINMLTDECKAIPADYDEAASGTWCNASIPERWNTDVSRVIHTYPDQFTLAGLSVVEDHGVDMAVIFENPATDLEPDFDDPLWGMTTGLERTFLAGRSADGVNPDITIDEIQRRFDPDRNDAITDMNLLWGFSKDTFRVLTYSYDNFDGVSEFMSTGATDIFNTYFNTLPVENRPDSASLLFVRELTQIAKSIGEPSTGCTAGGCTIDFGGQSEITQGIVNWAPYKRSGESWQPYDLNEYLDNLEAHLRSLESYTPEDSSTDARNYVDGQISLAKIYYRNLFNGVAMLIAINGTPVINAPVVINDEDVFSIFNGEKSKGQMVAKVVTTLVTTIMDGFEKNPSLLYSAIFGTKTDTLKSFIKALGKGISEKVSPITKLLTNTLRKVALGAAVFVIVAGLAVLAILYLNGSNSPAGMWAGRILFAAIGVVSAVLAGVALVNAIKSLKTVADSAKAAAVIGAVIGIVITWGVFFYAWGSSGVSFGSIAFNNMLADAIAATATIILLAAISCTGVGAIIVAVIGLIDALIMTICSLAGANDLEQDHWARQYVCIGISGWITKIFKWVLYSNTYLIDYENGERLSFNKVDQDLQDIRAGMTHGNNMKISVGVINTITKSKVPIDWKAAAYFWQYSDKNAKTSTFSYKVQPSESDIHDGLRRGDISSGWVSVGKSKWEQAFTAASDGFSIAVPEAGINQDPVVYISEGSALPVQECWAIYIPIITPVPIPVCYIRTAKATVNSEISSSLTVDVFPNDLDSFYTLAAENDGLKLSWGQTGDLKFPALKDADGDGLKSKASGGDDPDDALYDTDGDGLNDFFEIAHGMNPRMVDTDDDGLNDNLEVLYMTSPTRKDTDGDGLTDYEEVLGWLYTYDFDSIGAPMETMVYSDPLIADSDLDGLTDYLEKVYGFHPRVPQDSDVLDYELTVSEQDAPLVMLRFNETSGAMVFEDSSNYGFAGSCTAEECPLSGMDGRYAASVRFDGTDLIHLPTSAKAISLTDDQPFTIAAWVLTSTGGTVLAKWSDAAGGQQELRFEITPAMNLQVTSSSDTATGFGTVPTYDWAHIAASFDGSQVTFYINGNLAGVSSFTIPSFTAGSAPAEFTVGAYEGIAGPTDHFNGAIDELAYFDHALPGDFIADRLMTARYNFQDSYVRPGEELVYTSKIVNLLNSRFAYGLLTTIIDKTSAVVDWASKLLPATFVLYPDNPVVTGVNTTEIDSHLQIEPSHSTSEDLTISQTATAQIVDRRSESNLAELWLKLDETSGVTKFVDDSGSMPPRDAVCSDCPASDQNGILNKAVLFHAGETDRIDLPDLDTLNLLNRGYTISMWVKPDGAIPASQKISLLKSDADRLSINLVSQPGGSYLPEVLVNNVNKVGESWRMMKTSAWSHLVVEYFTTGSKLKVYINGGQIVDTTATLLTENASLWLGGAAAPASYFVDDLRIFSRPLTVTDINLLAERPVLALTMDGYNHDAYTDSSVYSQSISPIYQTPPHTSEAVRGQALNPRSGSWTGFIQVTGNSLLDMSDGSFTFSVWIYPTRQDHSDWQGIFGARTNTDSVSYPTLERHGKKLSFSFGSESHVSADVLTENKWNQVMVTFAPSPLEPGSYTFRLYIDSVLKESKTFTSKPAPATSFYVGSTSRTYTTNLYTLTMSNEHDAGSHAEVYIQENGSTIWSDDEMADGDTGNVSRTRTFSNFESVTYTVWEEDSSSGDDNCGSFSRNWYDLPDTADKTLYLSGGFDGSLTYKVTRPSIQFYGYIDELEIYRYALDSEQAYDLYYAVPVTARMPLDDRPSSTYFENRAVIGILDDGTCSEADETDCPAAGTIGLINQAVRFDGSQDVISVPVETTPNYMVSLWVNSTCENCGLYSLNNAANIYHQLYLKNGNVCSLAGDSEMCSRGGAITDGQWHFVVYANNGSTADLWLDGAKSNSLSGVSAVSSPGTEAQLGYAPAAGNPTLNGQLDDVRVFRYVQDDAVIAALQQRAPLFLAHLDEPDGSEVFDDATPSDFQLGCDGDACPTGGMEGRLRQSVEFNQVADALTLTQTQLDADAASFTASLWIYPTETKDSITQSLFTIANGANEQPRYALSLAPGSTYVSVQNAQNIAVGSIPQSNVELIKNTWNMITLVVEPNADNNAEIYSLYINGYLDSTWSSTTFSAGLGRITLGNSAGFSGLQSGPYIGKIDEVAIFEYSLNEIDIREMFAYQMGQVEETSSITLTIDAEEPQAALASYNPDFPYIDDNDRVLHVEASDATSGIGMVEMQVEHVNAPAVQWEDAPVCQDAPGGTAFCPTFIPAFGEGIYTLSFRAVDQVGNQTVTPTYKFYVDKTAPKIFANLQNGALYSAERHPRLKKTWFLHMEGQMFDDTLSQGSPGSGLDLSSIKVTVYSENGEVTGAGEQVPTLVPATNGYDWRLDYLFPEAEPSGALTVVIEAKDRVGNLAAKTTQVLLDASAPNSRMSSNQVFDTSAASLFDSSTMDGKLISSGSVSGVVDDEPNDGIPYMTPSGKLASSGVVRVEAAFEPSLGVSYLYNEPYPDGLLAWLPLDNAKLPEDASGNPDEQAPQRYFMDISPYQFAGECSGVSCPINGETGHKNGSIYFDGMEKYINLGQNVDLANRSFSALVWARRDSSGHSDPILWQGPLSMAGQRFLFGLDYQDRIVCGFGGTDLLTVEQYSDTGWHAYACTYDKDTRTRVIYRDGQAVASDKAATVPEMNENLFIGSAPVGSFKGSLDELMILDRALSLAEIRELYTGYQAVYHLAVDENFLANGDPVSDQSGYFQTGTLIASDDTNKVIAGMVGHYALRFDGDDRLAVNPAFSLSLDRGRFTQAAWIKPASGSAGSSIISHYDENPEQRYPSIYLTENYGLVGGFGSFYDWNELATADHVIKPNEWTFVVSRFDGTTFSLFVNGQAVAQTNAMAGMLPYPALRFNIGDRFVGAIDDVKVFTRALTDLEITAMARSGWRGASLAAAAGGLTWSAPVLPDMEGPYRVDVRGWDQFDHFDTSWNVKNQWSGVVDTLGPRFKFERTIDPNDPYLAHYTFSVEDTLLDESSIHQNLCTEMNVVREYFNSSWYLSTGVPPNSTLYRLSGTCSGDTRTLETSGFYACDLAGNCVMQEFAPHYQEHIYLPVVSGGRGTVVGTLSPALPPRLSMDQAGRAMQWATVAESLAPVDGGQAPQVDILTSELTPADARSIYHTILKGMVSDDGEIPSVLVEVVQNGAVIYSTNASVYKGLWNAVWAYPPGSQPANGVYIVRATAVDVAGQQASAEREIQVHLLP